MLRNNRAVPESKCLTLGEQIKNRAVPELLSELTSCQCRLMPLVWAQSRFWVQCRVGEAGLTKSFVAKSDYGEAGTAMSAVAMSCADVKSPSAVGDAGPRRRHGAGIASPRASLQSRQ